MLVVNDPPTRFVCKLVAMLGMTGSLASTAAGLFAPVFRMPKPTGPYRQGLPTRPVSLNYAITDETLAVIQLQLHTCGLAPETTKSPAVIST